MKKLILMVYVQIYMLIWKKKFLEKKVYYQDCHINYFFKQSSYT